MAALVRQAWRERNGGEALSGAAIKALLIAGARPVRGRASHARATAFEAGYGRIDVASSLPDAHGRTITIVDETHGLCTGEERLFGLDVQEGASLRAVLCWYDSPGERLINDLDLALVRPDGSVATNPDRTNTVEVLEAARLSAGRHLLRVSAFNVPDSPQPFALAVIVTALQ